VAGQGRQRAYTTEIVAERMQMLGSRSGWRRRRKDRGDETRRRSRGEGKAAKKPAGKFDDMDDDIPF